MAVAQNITLNKTPGVLEQLFWAHHKRILRAAYRVTGNMADAEDVAQTVFMRLAATGDARIETAESYLYRAAINGALDLIRTRRGDHEVSLELAAEVATSASSSSPERQLSNRELRTWLRQGIAGLSARSAEMFVLRYVEGLDNREISRLLGTSRAVGRSHASPGESPAEETVCATHARHKMTRNNGNDDFDDAVRAVREHEPDGKEMHEAAGRLLQKLNLGDFCRTTRDDSWL